MQASDNRENKDKSQEAHPSLGNALKTAGKFIMAILIPIGFAAIGLVLIAHQTRMNEHCIELAKQGVILKTCQ